MNHIEIELRYEILKPEQLPSFLLSFKKLHQTHDVDIYLDTSAALLYQRGIFIRIRNGKKLDIKFNRECLDNPNLIMQDYCEEHSFGLPLKESDLPKLNELLMSLNLKPLAHATLGLLMSSNNFRTHYIIDKVRTSYAYESFTLAIDEVADLGTFMEIELMANNVEILPAAKQQMQHFIKNLTLIPLRTGYGTLLLRKKNFQHYLLGRFVLEEDKSYRENQK